MMFFLIAIFGVLVASPLPSSDVQDLENDLVPIFSNDLGYTLIGEKPVSIEQNLDLFLDSHPDRKNQLFFFLKTVFRQSSRFILKVFADRDQIELINKASLSKQILRYKMLNDFVHTTYGTEDAFFKKLEDERIDIFEALDYHAILIAIALGYGEENGEFFCRRIELGRYLKKYPITGFYPFERKPSTQIVRSLSLPENNIPYTTPVPPRKKGVASFDEEWQEIKKSERKLYLEADPDPPYYIVLPIYVSKSGPESDAIHEGFLKARDKLAKLFCGRKFSEVIAEEAAKK
jgi:hypothetical protein